MKIASVLLLTSALVAVPSALKAEWYGQAGGGYLIPHDTDVSATVEQDIEFDSGWGALGAIGYKYGNGLRSEIELGYRDADVDSVSLSAVDNGSADVWSLMLNTLYDIDTGSGFKPYIGAGVGAAQLNYVDTRTIGGSTLDDSDIVPALQGIAGFSVPVAEQLELFGQYQYQYLFEGEPKTNSGLKADGDYASSYISAGLRYNFGAPEKKQALAPKPAPMPAPAPQPAPEPKITAPAIQKYMVFFDFNRSDLTIEAADILNKVVENAKAGKVARIDLSGHADRAGSDAYNDKLSQRRADVVKKQLTRLGISAEDISTSARGEREPLVPTNDGVREPQNRRVEIVYGN